MLGMLATTVLNCCVSRCCVAHSFEGATKNRTSVEGGGGDDEDCFVEDR